MTTNTMQTKDQLWDSLCDKYQHNEKLHHAVWKMKTEYQKIENERAAKKVKFITLVDLPKSQVGANGIKNTQTKRCAAITLSGKPCPFRATCGTFCKKHVV
jgi:hypothetical protein